MKYLFSILLAGFLFLNAGWSQTEKGNYMLGNTSTLVGLFSGAQPNQLSIGFGKNKVDKYEEAKFTNFNLSYNAGFFVADGLMLGLDIGTLYNNTTLTLKDERGEVIDEETFKQTNINLTPVARYYVNQGQKLQFFGELRGGLSIEKVDDNDADNYGLIGSKLGGAYFLNPKVSLDFFFDFNGLFGEIENPVGDNTRIFEGAMGLGLGFALFL